MLAPGMEVIQLKIALRHSTILYNMYARGGTTSASSDNHKITNAAGTTTKLVRRK